MQASAQRMESHLEQKEKLYEDKIKVVYKSASVFSPNIKLRILVIVVFCLGKFHICTVSPFSSSI